MSFNLKELLNRRSFIGKAVGVLCVAILSGCRSSRRVSGSRHSVALTELTDLSNGLTPFPVESVVLIRDTAGVAAMSLTCSHMKCQLALEERGLRCPCHGSHFALDGVPQQGPATEPLEFYELSLHPEGMLYIDKSKKVDGKWRLGVSQASG